MYSQIWMSFCEKLSHLSPQKKYIYLSFNATGRGMLMGSSEIMQHLKSNFPPAVLIKRTSFNTSLFPIFFYCISVSDDFYHDPTWTGTQNKMELLVQQIAPSSSSWAQSTII